MAKFQAVLVCFIVSERRRAICRTRVWLTRTVVTHSSSPRGNRERKRDGKADSLRFPIQYSLYRRTVLLRRVLHLGRTHTGLGRRKPLLKLSLNLVFLVR